MSLAIDYSSDGNINLNLLKSEIDRRVFRILGMLNEKPQTHHSQKTFSKVQDISKLSQPKESKQDNVYYLDVTPIRDTEIYLSDEKKSSNESDSKQKIQKSQNKCFNNLTSISDDIANQFSISFNNDEKIKTKNTKNFENYKPKCKQNINKELEISIFEKSGNKGKVSTKRTPLRSQPFNSKTASAAKRQSLNQTHLDERITVNSQLIERMRYEVKNYSSNNIKKEVVDNNVRSNLLRRIQGMAGKTKVFDMQ